MIKIICAVRDTVAEVFLEPRVEINVASAIRAFNHSVKDSPNKDDYALYQIGGYDDNKGDILPNEPLRIASGLDIKTDNVVDIPENLKHQAN